MAGSIATDGGPGADHVATPMPERRIGPVGLFIRGWAMGMADVVPGVSGGTVAFVTGIYERFIRALGSLRPDFLVHVARGDIRAAARALGLIHWHVLIPLGSGIALAIVLLSRVITSLMHTHPGPMYGLFFGLVLASAWIPAAKAGRRRLVHLAPLLAGAVGAWLFVGLQPGSAKIVEVSRADQPSATIFVGRVSDQKDLRNVEGVAAGLGGGGLMPVAVLDLRDRLAEAVLAPGTVLLRSKADAERFVADHSGLIVLDERRVALPLIFGMGMLAISAMVLPGVSGSFLLLFMGQYHAVFGALQRCVDHCLALVGRRRDVIGKLEAVNPLGDFLFLGAFLCGVVVGLAVFSRIVQWLLRRAHDATMAFLTGVMLGALRQPGEIVLAEAQRAGHSLSLWGPVVLTFAIGAAVVTVMGIIDIRRAAVSAAHGDGHPVHR